MEFFCLKTSKMELQTISSQMKVVIQKHQIIVTEMRNDPQNPVLEKRLRDLQSEIQSLNERQKQIMEEIRKNLEKKQSLPNSCSSNSQVYPAAPHPSSPHIQNQEVRMLCCAQKCQIQNHKLSTTTCQKPQVVNNCIPVAFTNAAPASVPHLNNNVEAVVARSSENCNVNSSEKYQPPHSSEKINHKIDQKKKDFLTALGLVSRDKLSDIKNKRLERKRRSTANPQFSNAALEEKWRNAAAAQAIGPPMKRPRGRPRLESKPVICPTNGICSSANAKPPVESSSPPDNSSANCTISSSSSPLSDSSTVMNGVHKQLPNTEEVKNVEQMLSGLCIVCTQPGDLVKCDTCAKQQHPGCMQPPLITRPQLPWQCSECQSRNVSLIVVQNYDMLRAAKEDEKRKLLKRSLELRLKRSQLESRLQQLSELSETQKSRQSEFQKSLRDIDAILERLHKVTHDIRLCS